MNNYNKSLESIKKEPISKLTLADCYLLAQYNYKITKSNDKVIIVRES